MRLFMCRSCIRTGASILASATLCLCAAAFAAPHTINYQARLTGSGGAPVTTAVTLTFTFWDSASGGSQLGDGFADADIVMPSSTGVVSTTVGDEGATGGIPVSVFASDSIWLNVNVDGTDLVPRERIGSVAFAIDAFPLYGPAHVIPEVTSDRSANGQNLLLGYARAKTLMPHGLPLSATNRAVVLIAPGQYDLGTTEVLLDAEFVDLVGMSTARADQYIFSQSSGPGTGVIAQTANDVHMENLTVECTQATGIANSDSNDPAAYFPASALPAVQVTNCEFRANEAHAYSMRTAITYSGTYIRCVGGKNAFAGNNGIANGVFTDCTGGDYSFGSGNLGASSGKFTNCTGGPYSFGGNAGTASGTFIRCTGDSYAFGGYGLASGKFTDCRGGSAAFGASGTASGNFLNCIGGYSSFGGGGTANGTFIGCQGDTVAFGGNGTASGLFRDCAASLSSFGGNGGSATGSFTNCTGGLYSFGGNNGAAQGSFNYCVSGASGFGGSSTNTGTAAGGKFLYCSGQDDSFTTNGTPLILFCVRNSTVFP